MSSDTATVETLTAEVRVLMVGNRQITQSVAKQLDRVKLSQLEVFGRVRLSGEDHLVIGRHLDGGQLVTANYRPSTGAFCGVVELGLGMPEEEYPVVCNADIPNSYAPSRLLLHLDGDPFQIDERDVRRCDVFGHYHHASSERCGGWDPRSCLELIRGQLREQREQHDLWAELNNAAIASPLIVLAGLR